MYLRYSMLKFIKKWIHSFWYWCLLECTPLVLIQTHINVITILWQTNNVTPQMNDRANS